VICWPLLGMVCCAQSAGMKAHAKDATAAVRPIVLLQCMSTSDWGLETKKKVYSFD
jgi:hypothetical protein